MNLSFALNCNCRSSFEFCLVELSLEFVIYWNLSFDLHNHAGSVEKMVMSHGKLMLSLVLDKQMPSYMDIDEKTSQQKN